jgi:molybdopterin-guanine dinucleotide biosynthesis protein A
MGGGDKTALDLGAGRSVLDHLVSDLDTSVPVVVVGPSRALERSVTWARESPVGGGPLAGVAAALLALPARPLAQSDDATWVVVIAGDQPFAAVAVPVLLAGREPGIDAVVAVDTDGRLQPLLAAYRRCALDRALASDPAVHGRSMHSLLDRLVIQSVAVPAPASLGVDDPAALCRAREIAARSSPPPSR